MTRVLPQRRMLDVMRAINDAIQITLPGRAICVHPNAIWIDYVPLSEITSILEVLQNEGVILLVKLAEVEPPARKLRPEQIPAEYHHLYIQDGFWQRFDQLNKQVDGIQTKLLSALEIQRKRYGNEEAQTSKNYIRNKGKGWEILYNQKLIRLSNVTGLNYISYLLHHPHTPISISELLQAHPTGDTVREEQFNDGELSLHISLTAGDELIDKKGLKQILAKLETLNEQIADAERNNDLSSANKMCNEKEEIEALLAKSTNVKGKSRKFNDPYEKARKSINKAITRAYDKVEEEDSELSKHLRKNIKTGMVSSYTPDPIVDWD